MEKLVLCFFLFFFQKAIIIFNLFLVPFAPDFTRTFHLCCSLSSKSHSDPGNIHTEAFLLGFPSAFHP